MFTRVLGYAKHPTAGMSEVGVRGAYHILADQLTLYQPGEQIMPTTVLRAPPGFSDLATALSSDE